MAKSAANPQTQPWWEWMAPMQVPVATCFDGEWSAEMKDVFHVD